MQLDGRIDKKTHTENNPQNSNDEKYPSLAYLLPHLLTGVALGCYFQFHIYPRFAELALYLLRPTLSHPLLAEHLHLQPLTQTSLMHISHAPRAFTRRYESVPGGGVRAQTNATFLCPTGSEIGKREAVLGLVQITQFGCGFDFWQHYTYLYWYSMQKIGSSVWGGGFTFKLYGMGNEGVIKSLDGSSDCFHYGMVHSYSNYNRMEEEETITLQDRLRMMKAISFSQSRQTLLKQKAFFHWMSLLQSKQQHAQEYYRMVLYVKGFKGIMEFVMTNREAQVREEEERQREMLRIEEQIQRKTKSLEMMRKRWDFRVFTRVIKSDIRLRHEKERAERGRAEKTKMQEHTKTVEMNQRYNKTEFSIRNRDVSPIQRTNLDRTTQDLMENSRRSMMSQGMASQESFKRKFVPIKSLPPKPIPSSIARKEPQTQVKQGERPLKQSEQSKVKSEKVIPPVTQQFPPTIAPPKAPQNNKQQSQPQISRLKQQILGLLSEIKMIEVNSLSEMVEQYGKAFKGQSSITQKHLIHEGIKLLSRISLIQ